MSDTTPADRCRGVLFGLAGEVAAAVTGLCRALIRGDAWDAAVRRCGLAALGDGPGNSGGFAPDVLRAALHFVGTSASFAEALCYLRPYSPACRSENGAECGLVSIPLCGALLRRPAWSGPSVQAVEPAARRAVQVRVAGAPRPQPGDQGVQAGAPAPGERRRR
jgi:hypothetical protein